MISLQPHSSALESPLNSDTPVSRTLPPHPPSHSDIQDIAAHRALQLQGLGALREAISSRSNTALANEALYRAQVLDPEYTLDWVGQAFVAGANGHNSDAKNLLENSLLRQEMLSDVDATMKLLDVLGFLPLAIIHAAAYINENDTTIAEYTALYNESETEVMEVLSEDFEVHGRYKTMKNSIAAAWLISFSQLARTNPIAIDYISLMACVSNHRYSSQRDYDYCVDEQ